MYIYLSSLTKYDTVRHIDRDRRLRTSNTTSSNNRDSTSRTNNNNNHHSESYTSSRSSNSRPSWMEDSPSSSSNHSSQPAWMDSAPPAHDEGLAAYGGGISSSGKSLRDSTSGGGGGSAGGDGLDGIQAFKAQMREMERREKEMSGGGTGREDEKRRDSNSNEGTDRPILPPPGFGLASTGTTSNSTDFVIPPPSSFDQAQAPRASVFDQLGLGTGITSISGSNATSNHQTAGGARSSRFAKFFDKDGKPAAPASSPPAVKSPSEGFLSAGSGGAAGGANKEDRESMNRLMGMLQVSGVSYSFLSEMFRTSSDGCSMILHDLTGPDYFASHD